MNQPSLEYCQVHYILRQPFPSQQLGNGYLWQKIFCRLSHFAGQILERVIALILINIKDFEIFSGLIYDKLTN